MNHAWTMDEIKIFTKNKKVTKAECKYCKTELSFEQPETSDNPDDVMIHPAHDCKKLPKEDK